MNCATRYSCFYWNRNEFINESIPEIVGDKIEKTDYCIAFSASDFPVEVAK